MRGEEGAFYSAEDADSLIEQGKPEHGEGAFYVWAAGQINQIIGPDGPLFNYYYGVGAGGNVPPEQHRQREFRANIILIVRHFLTVALPQFCKSENEIATRLDEAR